MIKCENCANDITLNYKIFKLENQNFKLCNDCYKLTDEFIQKYLSYEK